MRDDFRTFPLAIKILLGLVAFCYGTAAILYIFAAFGIGS